MMQPVGATRVARRVVVRARICWLALLALAALTVRAAGEPRTDAGLVWQAPVSCPGAAEVRARIERRLGTPADAAMRGIAVEIAPDAGGFVAHIDLRGVTPTTRSAC